MCATIIEHTQKIVALAEMGKQGEGIAWNFSEAARMPVTEVIINKSWCQQGSGMSFPIISNNSSYANEGGFSVLSSVYSSF